MTAIHPYELILTAVIYFYVNSHNTALGHPSVLASAGRFNGLEKSTNFFGNTYNVDMFLGIPYAEAPVGNLRFAKPVKKTILHQPYDAFRYGPACPQDPGQMKLWIPGDPYISEDCLSLNIFRPSGHYGVDLPVMIWLHGGAYVIGQSSIYSAENLVGFTNVIVVTLNYRLGPLGFLATDDNVAKGNYGLWDQQLALQWVHDNIEYFGGDKLKVTLFGESAGGSSSIYQAFYPPNINLFQRLITESGVSLAPWAYGDKKTIGGYTRKLGNILGCNYTDNAGIIECLRTIPYADIIAKSRVGTPEEELFRPEWVPVVDNEFIKQLPKDIFMDPNNIPSDIKAVFGSKDILLGTDSGDGSMISLVSVIPYLLSKVNISHSSLGDVVDNTFIPSVISEKVNASSPYLTDAVSYVYTKWEDVRQDGNNISVLRKVHDIVADTSFILPTRLTIRLHSSIKQKGSRTFLFRFSHHSSYASDIPWVPGCSHGDEIPYVFGFPESMRRPYHFPQHSRMPSTEASLSFIVMQYWTNFAKMGDPNSNGLPQWPEYDLNNETFMELDTPLSRSEVKMDPTRTALWTHLLPKILQDIQKTKESQHRPVLNNINPGIGLG